MLDIPESVTVVEMLPRDGFQRLDEFIPTEQKIEIIDLLSTTTSPYSHATVSNTSSDNPALIMIGRSITGPVVRRYSGDPALLAILALCFIRPFQILSARCSDYVSITGVVPTKESVFHPSGDFDSLERRVSLV